jgi:hypothetical protein
MADYTRGQVGKQGIPCALAQAFVDYKIALYCSFGIGPTVTGLDGPWIFPVGYGRRDAQSLVLPNGNIQHQWNVLCASIFTNGAER